MTIDKKKDDFPWKITFDEKWPLIEDKLLWQMSLLTSREAIASKNRTKIGHFFGGGGRIDQIEKSKIAQV